MSAPLIYVWNGSAMEPLRFFREQAAKQFKVGTAYRLVETERRSMESHRHFFACLNAAWANLPEDVADFFRTPDELRKWALTHTEALRVAQFLGDGPDYSRVAVDGRTVTQFKPLSQAWSQMDSREFQKSKQAVLDVLAEKIGVNVEELMANAGNAA